MRFGQVSGRHSKAILKTALTATLLGTAAWGQTDYFPASSTYGFTANKLYLGAEFRVTGLVTVTLKDNHASALGELWYINPTNGSEVFLFRNKDLPKPSVSLPLTIPVGSILTFFYKTTEPGYFNDKKYSGPNIPGVSTYVNPRSSDANLDPNNRWGARYCVVGRERDAFGTPTGNLEFGFEDESDHSPIPNSNPPRSWSDMDFNDIIFSVSGLEMGIQTRSLASKGLVK